MRDQATLQDTGGRLAAVDTADAYGAGVGRALERLGQKGFEVANEFAERDAERDARDADTEYQRRIREIMLGREPKPDDETDEGVVGFLQMEGEDAAAHRIDIERQLELAREDIAARRRSGRARDAFLDVSSRRLESSLGQADQHVLTQTRVLQDASRQAAMAEALDAASAHYMNEAEAASHINAGLEIVLAQADADGLDERITDRMLREFSSRAWAAVILRRAEDDPAGAEALITARRGVMTTADLAAVMDATSAVRSAERSRRTVDELLETHGGDYVAAMAAARLITNTVERDEAMARLRAEGLALEQAETLNAENAEERARAALTAGGQPSTADRALLVREGRWSTIVSSISSGSSEASVRFLQNQGEVLLLLSETNPQIFHTVVDAMRGVRDPAVTDEMIVQRTGRTREQWASLRDQIVGADAARMSAIVRRQREMRGEIPVGGGNDTNVIRLAARLNELGAPIAQARLGLDVRRPSLVQTLTGQAGDQNRRNSEWTGFLMEEARRFYEQSGGAEPTHDQMMAIISRATARGTNGRGAFEARPDTPNNMLENGQEVIIRFADIDPARQRELHRAYRETNSLGLLPMDQIPEGRARQYLQMWRQYNPGVTPAPGSPEHAAMENFVREMATDDPARTSAMRDRVTWMQERYAEELQGY
jgi:hypothetical protein